MQSPLFHVLFYILFCVLSAVALVSCVVAGVIGIWWQFLVSEVLRRTPEHVSLAQQVFAHSNVGMFKMIRLAEDVDKALAKRMRLLMTVLHIAALIFLVSGLPALLVGGVVFAGN
jgi:uncharacterized protein involved in cysteine biosynthesis